MDTKPTKKSGEKKKGRPKGTRNRTAAEKEAAKRAKKPVGRPEKYDDGLGERICDFVRMGSYLETAAAAVGIDRTTLYAWLKHGNVFIEAEDAGKPRNMKHAKYKRFVENITKAAAEAELMDLQRIDAAADNIWQAAAWKLERKHPQRYALTNRVEMTGKNGGPLETKTTQTNVMLDVIINDLPLEAQKQLLTVLQQKQAADAPKDADDLNAG